MAYSAAPGRRMAWDADGTVGVWRTDTGILYALGSSVMTELNDEDSTNAQAFADDTYGWLIFPELRDLDGMFFGNEKTGTHGIKDVATSPDTTNGLDGTWTQQTADVAEYTDVYANYRNNITSLSVSNIRGFRWHHTDTSGTMSWRAVHVYGKIASGETPDRILFIDVATGLEFTTPYDWGDIPRGTTHDKTIRVKNNSSTLTANTTVLSFEDLYLGSSSWYTIKETGGSFATTLSITSIAAGVTYPTGTDLITIRKATPDAETLGLHAARCKAATTSWT